MPPQASGPAASGAPPPDLLRWDEAVARGELLPAAVGWSFSGYGYGWRIGTLASRRAYFHTGDNSGYLAVNTWLSDEQVTLAVLANDQAADIFLADMLELAT